MPRQSVCVGHLISAYSFLILNYFGKQEKLTETYIIIYVLILNMIKQYNFKHEKLS